MENFVINVYQDEKDPANKLYYTDSSVSTNGVAKYKTIQYADLSVGDKAIYDAFKTMIVTLTNV